MFQRYEVVTNAAREGARLAVLPGYSLPRMCRPRVAAYLSSGRVPTTATNPNVDRRGRVDSGGRRTAADQRETRHGYLHLHISVPERPVGVLRFARRGSAQGRLGDAHRSRFVESRRRRSNESEQTHSGGGRSSRCCWQRWPVSACIAWCRRARAARQRRARRSTSSSRSIRCRSATRLTKDHVKLVKWPAETQVPGAFAKVDDVVDRGLIATVEENEPLIAAKLAPLEAGAGLPPSIPTGHARRLGQGQRSGRRGRLRRPRHSRRRHGHADEPPGAAGEHDPRGRQQCPGAHRGHPHTTRRTPRTANRFPRPW